MARSSGTFNPGHLKSAGRVKGSLNRDTREAVQIMVEAGYNPIAAMVKLAMTEDTPVEMQVKLASELARYAYHPRKAMDLWHFDHNFRNPKSGSSAPVDPQF